MEGSRDPVLAARRLLQQGLSDLLYLSASAAIFFEADENTASATAFIESCINVKQRLDTVLPLAAQAAQGYSATVQKFPQPPAKERAGRPLLNILPTGFDELSEELPCSRESSVGSSNPKLLSPDSLLTAKSESCLSGVQELPDCEEAQIVSARPNPTKGVDTDKRYGLYDVQSKSLTATSKAGSAEELFTPEEGNTRADANITKRSTSGEAAGNKPAEATFHGRQHSPSQHLVGAQAKPSAHQGSDDSQWRLFSSPASSVLQELSSDSEVEVPPKHMLPRDSLEMVANDESARPAASAEPSFVSAPSSLGAEISNLSIRSLPVSAVDKKAREPKPCTAKKRAAQPKTLFALKGKAQRDRSGTAAKSLQELKEGLPHLEGTNDRPENGWRMGSNLQIDLSYKEDGSPILATTTKKSKASRQVVSSDDEAFERDVRGEGGAPNKGTGSALNCQAKESESRGFWLATSSSSIKLSSDSKTEEASSGFKRREVAISGSSRVPAPEETSAAGGRNTGAISARMETPVPTSHEHVGSKSFLVFRRQRDKLASKAFKEFNEMVFDNELPADLQITWSTTLQSTAGCAKCTMAKLPGELQERHTANVEVSEKVCDSEERLRATLLHELCHVAAWLIDHEGTAHGRSFKKWGRRAERLYPEMEPAARCHKYKSYKPHRRECTGCQAVVLHQSKPAKKETKVCVRCKSMFRYPGRFNRDGKPASQPQPNAHSVFVKRNFGSDEKKQSPRLGGIPTREVLKAVAAKWQQHKFALSLDQEPLSVKLH